jgi:hypothetical protein
LLDGGKILDAAILGPDRGNDLTKLGEEIVAAARMKFDGGEDDDHGAFSSCWF